MGMERWPDYLRFHELALSTRDVDPVYPVLRQLLEDAGEDPAGQRGLWLSVCHLTWYHMGSALAAWGTGFLNLPTLPCATERRGNRDPKQLQRNIAGWVEASKPDGLRAFLTRDLGDDRRENWQMVMDRIETVHGNGRWASYKLAEILIKVNGLPLEPFHMGHANSSGPRRGLETIWPTELPQGDGPKDVAYLDAVSDALVSKLVDKGLPAPVEEVETTLCDFHALCDGRYYVGNDIDQMQAQLLAVPTERTEAAFAARAKALPNAYLGELNGWEGIDKARQRVYRDTGEVIERV